MESEIPLNIYLIRVFSYLIIPAVIGSLVDYFLRSPYGFFRRPRQLIQALIIGITAGFILAASLPLTNFRGISELRSYEAIIQFIVFAFLIGFSVRRFMDTLSNKLLVKLEEKIEPVESNHNDAMYMALDRLKKVEKELQRR